MMKTAFKDITLYRHSFRMLAPLLLVGSFLSAPSVRAQEITPDQAAAECCQWFRSVNNIQELSSNVRAIMAFRRCVDLGIDPPLDARPDGGRLPSTCGGGTSIPARSCPPIGTCLYGARLSGKGDSTLDLNEGDPTKGGTVDFNAPQFIGDERPSIPGMENGGSVYFFEPETALEVPDGGFVWPDTSANYFSDGGNEEVPPGHVTTVGDKDGDILKGDPIVLKEDADLRFRDGGYVILPDGFNGKVGGIQLKGGDLIYIKHDERLKLPAGSKLYPLPDDPSHDPVIHPPASRIVTTITNPDQKITW